MLPIHKTATVLLALISLTALFSSQSLASDQSMTNEEYILDLNPTKTKVSPSPTPIKSDSKKSEPILPHKNSTLNLKVDANKILYGQVHPGEPIVRSINIQAAAPQGFDVIAYETGNLASSDNQVVPDATCDEGNCTELVSALWKSPLTYGFGYRLDSKCTNPSGCLGSFKNDYFKQFSNIELHEVPQSILTSNSNEDTQTKISLKVNIPTTLQDKTFINTIHLIALKKLEE